MESAMSDEAEKLKIEIEEVKNQIAKKVGRVDCLAYGVGAAGRREDSKSGKDFLNCPNDLNNFRAYCEEKASGVLYMGSIHHEGVTNGGKEFIIDTIRRGFAIALRLKKSFVLYYTGHGRETVKDNKKGGDWCFSDGRLSFKKLFEILESEREIAGVAEGSSSKVYVICDCCHSGEWVNRWKDHKSPKWIRIIASCDANNTCKDGVFSSVFFGWNPLMTDSYVDNLKIYRYELHKYFIQKWFYKTKYGHRVSINGKSYNKSAINKMCLDELKTLLKELRAQKRKQKAVAKFLKVGPRFCGYEFSEEDAAELLDMRKKGFKAWARFYARQSDKLER